MSSYTKIPQKGLNADEVQQIVDNSVNAGWPASRTVTDFASLPSGEPAGSLYFVETETGSLFTFNRRQRGLYRSDGAGGWEYSGDNTYTAIETAYDNSGSDLTSLTVQSAVDTISNDLTFRQVKIVKEAADLANIDSTLLYFIDGVVDMGTQQIEVPSTGFFFLGHDYFVSKLVSSADNYTMFVNAAGQPAGNVRGRNVSMCLNGNNSRVLNLDNQGNFGACEFLSCNFGDFSTGNTGVGELSNYRQFRLDDSAFIRINDGLTFSGTWVGSFSITDSIMLSIPAGVTCFKQGTSLVFNGISFCNINAFSIDNATTAFDFNPTNFSQDRGFSLSGARFNAASNPIPNMPEVSTKRFFRDCTGVTNTFIGGRWNLTTQVITPLTVGVQAKALGTTTYDNLVHFTGSNNNEFVYESTQTTDIIVSGNIVVDGGPNDLIDIIIRKFDASAGVYIDLDVFSRQISNVLGGLDIAYFAVNTVTQMDENDRIELWIRNNTDGTDATVLNGSYLRVSQR